MTEPRAFLCFDLVHNVSEQEAFVADAKTSAPGFTVESVSITDATREPERTQLLRQTIGRCDVMIILVGKETIDSPNVAAEILLAKRANVPYFGVYVDGVGENDPLPLSMARNRTVKREWPAIQGAVTQLMHEGKHHAFA